jgi:hypothetical protein
VFAPGSPETVAAEVERANALLDSVSESLAA